MKASESNLQEWQEHTAASLRMSLLMSTARVMEKGGWNKQYLYETWCLLVSDVYWSQGVDSHKGQNKSLSHNSCSTQKIKLVVVGGGEVVQGLQVTSDVCIYKGIFRFM